MTIETVIGIVVGVPVGHWIAVKLWNWASKLRIERLRQTEPEFAAYLDSLWTDKRIRPLTNDDFRQTRQLWAMQQDIDRMRRERGAP